jgi:hypothetical protein
MTRSRWWFVAFLTLVFLAGGFSGVLLDRLWLTRGGPAPGAPGPFGRVVVDRSVQRLDRQLDLSADQERELATVIERWVQRAALLQVEARERFRTEQAALRRDIEEVLTAEQIERFRQMTLEGLGGRLGGGPADGRGRGRGPRPRRE